MVQEGEIRDIRMRGLSSNGRCFWEVGEGGIGRLREDGCWDW